MSKIYNVVIADDHPLIVDAIKTMIKKSTVMNIIATAINGKDTLDIIKRLNNIEEFNNIVDVLIFDINMPELNGIDLSEIIYKEYPKIKMIAVTMRTDIYTVKMLIDNKVRAIVDKSSELEDLNIAIEEVLKGYKYYSKNIEKLIQNNEEMLSLISKIKITKREKEVLYHLSIGNTSPVISKLLNTSIPTINSHRQNLIAKFEVNNVAELIRKATEHNYI